MIYPFDFHGLEAHARPSGALYLPLYRWLVVADLHLGRSARFARRGGALLPPYETAETLRRLSDEVAATRPARIISLGDSFDDDASRPDLPDWPWTFIRGNHDPASGPDSLRAGAVTLRHIAGQGIDISGHYHPVTHLNRQRWRCFAIGRDHLILPAFGTYTGGLDIADPAINPMVAGGVAVLCAHRALPVPIKKAAPTGRPHHQKR